MSGTIITVAQQKGGAGKTTLVAHLAVSLMQRGLSVALVDIDPQASLSYWYDARQESFGDEETGLTHSKISGWRTQREVEELAASHDVVLIDKGARDGLTVGNVLAIYKTGEVVRDRVMNERVQLPAERAGLLMVFRAYDKMSYGIVLQASRQMAILDQVRNP